MPNPDLQHSAAGDLARLLAICDLPADWSDRDLAAIWRHQLRTSLAVDLAAIEPDIARRLEQLAEQGCCVTTFGELLAHAAPPVELLQYVKQFARKLGAAEHTLLPLDVSAVLYLAAIGAARVQSGQSITSIEPDALRQRLEWAAARGWLDDATRRLLRAAADRDTP